MPGFPYFVEISPGELKAGFENVQRLAAEGGRDPGQILFTCCRQIEVTREPVSQDERHLRGTPEQLVEALNAYREDRRSTPRAAIHGSPLA